MSVCHDSLDSLGWMDVLALMCGIEVTHGVRCSIRLVPAGKHAVHGTRIYVSAVVPIPESMYEGLVVMTDESSALGFSELMEMVKNLLIDLDHEVGARYRQQAILQ